MPLGDPARTGTCYRRKVTITREVSMERKIERDISRETERDREKDAGIERLCLEKRYISSLPSRDVKGVNCGERVDEKLYMRKKLH